MNETSVTKTIIINAAPEAVFEFLTNKDKLGEWFHPAEANLEAGQDFALMGGDEKICWGKVNKFNPPNELDYTFTVKPMGGKFTQVSWTLEPCGTGTKLTLIHSGLETTEQAMGLLQALDKGWDSHLTKLRDTLN